MSNLYYIENCGCDATTHGLVRVSDDDFPKFKSFIENLNKNSYYVCMPTIEVYKIEESDIREFVVNPDAEWGDDDYVDKDEILYLDGETYTFAEGVTRWDLYNRLERII